ncbi:MAG TPA: hypothetical protein H9672_05760 [Firmicutes bacterium]|nr:hypothetical protein [Bacillota bacterium]
MSAIADIFGCHYTTISRSWIKYKVYESFTATTKREAERLAAVWAADRTIQAEDITVLEAVQKYINAKTP